MGSRIRTVASLIEYISYLKRMGHEIDWSSKVTTTSVEMITTSTRWRSCHVSITVSSVRVDHRLRFAPSCKHANDFTMYDDPGILLRSQGSQT